MNKREIANFIHKFVEWKYHGLIAYSDIEKGVIEFPDGRFGFNCHKSLEHYGIRLDQFKKDFSDLLTIFRRVEKE